MCTLVQGKEKFTADAKSATVQSVLHLKRVGAHSGPLDELNAGRGEIENKRHELGLTSYNYKTIPICTVRVAQWRERVLQAGRDDCSLSCLLLRSLASGDALLTLIEVVSISMRIKLLDCTLNINVGFVD